MAITFENVIYERVISNIHDIIANEFSVQIFFDNHVGHSFVITPVSDENIDTINAGQLREVTVAISYQLPSNDYITKQHMKQVTMVTERLKRLLFNNNTYAVSGVNQFRNGRIVNIEYQQEEDTMGSVTTFSCETMELV